MKHLYQNHILILSTIIITSCGNNSQKPNVSILKPISREIKDDTIFYSSLKNDYVLAPINASQFDSINLFLNVLKGQSEMMSIMKYDGDLFENIGELLRRQSQIEKNWRKLANSCFADQNTNKMRFLGVTTQSGPGSIYLSDFITKRTDLDQVEFTDAERKRLYSEKGSSSCDFNQTRTVDARILLQTNSTLLSQIDDSLFIASMDSSNLRVRIGTWKRLVVNTGELIPIMENSSIPSIKNYYRWFKEKGNLFYESCIEIDDFAIVFKIKNGINSDFKAKLKQPGGLKENLNGDIEVQFNYISDTEVSMITKSKFYVFADPKVIYDIRPKN